MIQSLLIANRGEIAVRVARTAREMGIEPVGVYAESDADSYHVRQMSRAFSLGQGPALETYLSVPKLIGAAKVAGVQAVHPGYGFLSESAAFARAVKELGLFWIGPPPQAIEDMGDKLAARRRMKEAGIPVVPGTDETAADDDALARKAAEIGVPLLVKASAGGGGKGMSRVERLEDLPEALAEARRIAQVAFGSDRVYLERYLDKPRHIEFQVFGDRFGSVVHLFERECSVQRRHQKILEETPSAALDPRLREAMGRAAVEAARAVGYVGAGTVEFLLDERRNFYFLEMNTRLQVEHPITEETLGLDLVRSQIQIALGEALPAAWRGGKLAPQGHAIELRLNAEDPVSFLPRSGRLRLFEPPSGPGIRVDAGVESGSAVSVEYDPLLAKLIVLAPDRRAAIERARRALAEWVILGVETNLPLLQRVLESRPFVSGRYATDLVEQLAPAAAEAVPDAVWIAGALALSAPAVEGEVPRKREPWDEASGWRAGA
ncbi:MAG TPA: biotin carboxylase N-terminal domain-containing protein [Thermoanaerobaculia bacterium]